MRAWISRMSVRKKLTAITFFGMLFPLVLSLGVASALELSAMSRELASEIHVMANMASEFGAADLAFKDRDSCQRTLQALARRPDVVIAALHAADGSIFCSYRQPGTEASEGATALAELTPRVPRLSDGIVEIVWPAEYQGSRFGALYLRATTDSLAERRTALVWGVGLGLVGLGGFVLLLTLILERVISRPIQKLALATQHISDIGDYSVRVATSSGDEIGALANSFNQMVAEIARRQDALQKSEHALKESYERLAQTQKELVEKERLAAVGELAAVMAHEVRNPLGVIFNSLDALRRNLEPTGAVPELLFMLREEADRLSRIVDDLLDFTRPNAPNREPAPLETLIASAAEVASSAAGGGARVELELAAGMAPANVDGRMVRQVLINLILNAIQAAPADSTVRVRALEEQSNGTPVTRIDVVDEGPGIDGPTLSRVFQPFFTTKAKGTGLGLAVVRRFVEAHGGEVRVESAVGRGSTFSVTLPQEG